MFVYTCNMAGAEMFCSSSALLAFFYVVFSMPCSLIKILPNFSVVIEENTCCFQRILKPGPHILNNVEDLIFNTEGFVLVSINIFVSNIETF